MGADVEILDKGGEMNLYKHQSDAVAFAVRNGGSVALFHDPGCGKTLTTLEIFSHYRAITPGLRLLVVCPLSLINAAWGEDTKKFTEFKYLPYSEIKNVPRGRPGCLDDADIIGINFESLITEKRFKEIQKLLCSGPWMICVDESSRMKNHKSITTKALLRLAPLARYRIVASGTPMPNCETEGWGQSRFIKEDSFPASFFQFRNQYFHLARGNQVMADMRGRVMTKGLMAQIFQQGWKYCITPEKREALINRMSFAHWVCKEDALDLPEKIDEIRYVRFNPNEKKAYESMRKHLVAEIKNGKNTEEIVAEVCLAKLQKLRQITSGFCYNEEHDALHPGRSSKMRELKDTLEEVVGKKQAIIWINFREEVYAISEMLKEEGITFSTLFSETENKDASIKDFQEGRSQILIANSQSAGHGLTFINCSLCIYFSLSYSFEQYAQSRDRVHRIGQVNKCLYVHLIVPGTIDQMVLDVLQRKKTLQDIIYELVNQED